MKPKARYLFDQFVAIRILSFQDEKDERLELPGNSPFRTPAGILLGIYSLALLSVRMAHDICLYM